MKTLLHAVAVGIVGIFALVAFSAAGDVAISAAVQIHAKAEFEAPLAAHGTWIEVGSYGRCWRPAHVAVEWRPYCVGHWVWTDCGWYWASDEPWGWACYHYGYWMDDTEHGWIWVPGVEWAPAWVSWRVGGDYCGWAPLPPPGLVVAPRLFVFVEARHFHEPVTRNTVVVNNTTIINKTKTVEKVRIETRNLDGSHVQKVRINEGPDLATIQEASHTQIKQVPIHLAMRQTPVPESHKKTVEPGIAKQPEPFAGQPGGKIPPHAEPPPKARPPGKDVAPPGLAPAVPRHSPPGKSGTPPVPPNGKDKPHDKDDPHLDVP